MLSWVMAKNVGDVFLRHSVWCQAISYINDNNKYTHRWGSKQSLMFYLIHDRSPWRSRHQLEPAPTTTLTIINRKYTQNIHTQTLMYTWVYLLDNTAQNSSDNFPYYPPDKHHCSDAVWWSRREAAEYNDYWLLTSRHELGLQLCDSIIVMVLFQHNNKLLKPVLDMHWETRDQFHHGKISRVLQFPSFYLFHIHLAVHSSTKYTDVIRKQVAHGQWCLAGSTWPLNQVNEVRLIY